MRPALEEVWRRLCAGEAVPAEEAREAAELTAEVFYNDPRDADDATLVLTLWSQ